MKNIYIVIPAYNEERHLPLTIRKLKSYPPLNRVIVVDDGSKFPIEKFLPPAIMVARHRVNLGKGMALKTGCELAIKSGAKSIILMDADGQHDPKEIPQFIRLLDQGNQMIFGARRMHKGMPFGRLIFNRVLSRFTSGLFGLRLRDVACGYKAFQSKVYSKISWKASDYSSDIEMVVHAGINKLRCQELLIDAIYLDKRSATGITIQDGIKLVGELFLWKLRLKW